MPVRAVTETSESVRRWVCRSGECVRSGGVDGDMTGDALAESPYSDFMGPPRSGLAGKTGIPGEKAILFGETGTGGSSWTGDSLRRANLTVLKGYVCLRREFFFSKTNSRRSLVP